MKKIFQNSKETSVSTSLEYDVNYIINERIEKAIQSEIEKCSNEFYRNIKVNFTTEIR